LAELAWLIPMIKLIYYIFCFLFIFALVLLFFMESWHFYIDLVWADLFVTLLLLIHRFPFVANTSKVVTIAAVWILYIFISYFNIKVCIENLVTESSLFIIWIDSFLERLLDLSLRSDWRALAITLLIFFLLIIYLLLFASFLVMIIRCYDTFGVKKWFFRKKNCIFRIVLNI
jgi:hypothetical protein